MNPGEEPTQVGVYADHADQAKRCRRLAESINDRETARLLEDMAAEYDRRGGRQPGMRPLRQAQDSA